MIDNSAAGFATTLEMVLADADTQTRMGKVSEVTGTLVRVSGLDLSLGELCELLTPSGEVLQRAEVVGLARQGVVISPFGSLIGISSQTLVRRCGRPLSVPVGPALLGRVLDAMGQPIDGKGPLKQVTLRSVMADPPDPMQREMIKNIFPTGVRAIDALLTIGEGQRIGVFAPAGVGKSTLMGMLARGAVCDIIVITLIGERGREVREFVELILGTEGMKRAVVICATSDRSAIERAKAAHAGTAIAEYFRDQGAKVLLMMDSLTRFARAMREIGLASGEPPARRGFPPSVFAELPRLVERSGMGKTGSITALYTILADDESGGDPISEEVRGLLDGHIVLSRRIAAKNQYPAIDVLESLSRVMSLIVDQGHQNMAGRLRQLMAKYDDVETLLQAGEYEPGQDADADLAIERIDQIREFLGQPVTMLTPYARTIGMLQDLVQ
ncbi:MAG: type III secretion system ATPase SctN [Pseudomonadota bacterium]